MDTPVTETSSYSFRNVGSGATTAATGDLYLGNRTGVFKTAELNLSLYQMINSRLSLAELRAIQYTMFPSRSDQNIFIHLGWNGTGTQVDWSGNRNNGTVTGATVANHAPLGYVPHSAAKILQAEGRVAPFIMSRPGIV